MLPDSWFNDVRMNYGETLTDEMIVNSVQQASDFFNIDNPMAIAEDWTTGVYPNMDISPIDDVLIFVDNVKMQNSNNPIPTPTLSFFKVFMIITNTLAIIPMIENIIPTSEPVIFFFFIYPSQQLVIRIMMFLLLKTLLNYFSISIIHFF